MSRLRAALNAMNAAMPRSVTDYAQALANITVAVSAAIAAAQYVESRRDARVSRTLEMLERFEGETYAAPRRFAEAALDDVQAQVSASLPSTEWAALPAHHQAELVDRVTRIRVYGMAKPRRLPPELAQITGFFNSLQTCIEQRVCDGPTAHGQFDVYATSFWNGYQAVIDQERRGPRPRFAAGLEAFVAQADVAP